MNKDIVINRIKKEGVPYAAAYYFLKAVAKAEEFIIGRLAKPFFKPKNIIVFKNRQGQDYSDNARALFDYMVENGYNTKYKLVWLVSDKKNFKQCNVPNVRFATAENKYGWSSLAAYYYGNMARYFFYTNNTADLNRYRCSEQLVVNLWHGCGYKGTTHRNKGIKYSKSMEMFDYALVPGELFVEAKASYWECDKSKILPVGYPRYDWILDKDISKTDIINRLYPDMASVSKLVLWLPTFRKTASVNSFAEGNIEFRYGVPLIDSIDDLVRLNELCVKKDVLLVVKRHPIQLECDIEGTYSNIKFLDDSYLNEHNVILYHLLGVSDAVISDYSSAAVDFMLLDRPIAYILKDFEEYKASRGFVFEDPIMYMPGEKVYNYEELEKFITDVSCGADSFADARNALMPIMHNNDTGCYCKRLIDILGI